MVTALQQRPENRITEVYPGVHEYLSALFEHYRARHPRLRDALEPLVDRGRADPQEFALPLLVHAAITGAPEPAVPVAAVHALWWRAANTFDDVADGDAGEQLYGLGGGVALTTALECGYALPLRALSTMDAPRAVRDGLVRDFFDGWTDAVDGQLGDIRNRPAEVDPAEVLAAYGHKSGAIYAMTCGMAARLALGGAAGSRTAPGDGAEAMNPVDTGAQARTGWRRFGHLLGMLAQFRNDGDDLRSGRYEDLRNGTATYLLVHLLHTADPGTRQRALELLDDGSHRSRRELAGLMLRPAVLEPYEQHVAALADEARALLDTLAPDSPFTEPLRARVDAELQPLGAAEDLAHPR